MSETVQLECTCESNPHDCEYPLHRALLQKGEEIFGEYVGAEDEPQYIVSLDGDTKTDIPIVDRKSTKAIVDALRPIDSWYGHAVDDGEQIHWTEPAVGIGISYSDQHRWAYISDKTDDSKIESSDLHVERIYAGETQLEVYAARDDTTLIDLS